MCDNRAGTPLKFEDLGMGFWSIGYFGEKWCVILGIRVKNRKNGGVSYFV